MESSTAAGVPSSTAAAGMIAAFEASISEQRFRNAVFLGERLYAASPSQETLRMVATAYTHAGQLAQARHVLAAGVPRVAGGGPGAAPAPLTERSAANSFLLGKVCLGLNKLREAERALRGAGAAPIATDDGAPSDSQLLAPEEQGGVAGGSAGLELMGEVCRKSGRPDEALLYFGAAHRADPYAWTAYEQVRRPTCC